MSITIPPTQESISTFHALDLIRKHGSRYFTVFFVKRQNGQHRRMTCRIGVRKGVEGVGRPYDASERDLLGVHETVLNGNRTKRTQFRVIPKESIYQLHINGKRYRVCG
jgi:hypothetical protein